MNDYAGDMTLYANFEINRCKGGIACVKLLPRIILKITRK